MPRRAWVMLLVLASLWGGSYLFIKVALDDLSPALVVFLRTALAGLLLLPLALQRGALTGLRRLAGPLIVLAALQVAAPFLLISIGEEEISSSLAGILVASAPIFTALLAVWVDAEERSHGGALVGVVVGIAGVGLLLGVDLGGAALVGGLLVVLASVGYALGGFYLKRHFAAEQPLGVVTVTMLVSAALTLTPAAVTVPDAALEPRSAGAMLALGLLGTGVAFVIFYTLIADYGPARASLVAYIAPIFAVLYGVLLLDEQVGAGTLAGLALIVAGSWLAAGGTAPGRVTLRGEPA